MNQFDFDKWFDDRVVEVNVGKPNHRLVLLSALFRHIDPRLLKSGEHGNEHQLTSNAEYRRLRAGLSSY